MRRSALASVALAVLVLATADAPIAEGAPAKPTTLATELEGGAKHGERITVTEGEGVDDRAYVLWKPGELASNAVGTVHFKVYSDGECTHLVQEVEGREVSRGTTAPTESLTLSAGTYYWQASYTGDENNQPSTSKCGSEVETVEAPAVSFVEQAVA
jgi:hypothetical protein